MRSPLHFLFIAALVTLAACGGAATPTTAPPTSTPTASPTTSPATDEIQLLTQNQPSQACEDALATGTLVPDPRSGLGLAGPDGVVNPVMWPFGYTARVVENEIELYDDQGAFVAREGNVISMGGGSGANNLFYACAGSVQIAD